MHQGKYFLIHNKHSKGEEYCNGLYNHSVAKDDSVLNDLADKATQSSPAPKITISEVENAIQSLKNHKSTGTDNIPRTMQSKKASWSPTMTIRGLKNHRVHLLYIYTLLATLQQNF